LTGLLTNDIFSITMSKTASVADLRNNFATVSRWIYEGESVTIQKRGKPFAVLTPAEHPPKNLELPDFEARMKRYCPEGFKGETSAEIVDYIRGDY
jgi:prevent-host-death family protein